MKKIFSSLILLLITLYFSIGIYGELRKDRCIEQHDVTELKKIDANTFYAYSEYTGMSAIVSAEYLLFNSKHFEASVCTKVKPYIGKERVVSTFTKD